MRPTLTAPTAKTIDPGRAHDFRETNDAGIGAVSSGGGGFVFAGFDPLLLMTTAVLRATRCAAPGCGKPREDPIHSAAD